MSDFWILFIRHWNYNNTNDKEGNAKGNVRKGDDAKNNDDDWGMEMMINASLKNKTPSISSIQVVKVKEEGDTDSGLQYYVITDRS